MMVGVWALNGQARPTVSGQTKPTHAALAIRSGIGFGKDAGSCRRVNVVDTICGGS